MKKLLIIAIIFIFLFSTKSFAQKKQANNFGTDTVDASTELVYMKNCINNFSKKYTTGSNLKGWGYGIVGTGGLIAAMGEPEAGIVLGTVGFILLISGQIVQHGAFIELGRAGLYLNPSGGRFVYRFK